MRLYLPPLEAFSWLLLVPLLALIGIFILFPLVWSVYLSFTDYELVGVKARKYSVVGFENYLDLIGDHVFHESVVNSFLFTLFSALIGQAFLGLGLAMLMRAQFPATPLGRLLSILRNLAIALVFTSWVIPETVAGYAWAAITEKGGLITSILGIDERLYLKYPLETIIVANIWRGTAFSMILFAAALESIPRYIYEAAEIDGASPWQRFRYVTLPLIAHVILIDFILITIWTFGVFTMPFIMLREQPSVLWTLFVYSRAISIYKPSYAAAAANIMFVVVLALILAYLKLMGRLQRWLQ
jgi:multiple sugar transport system permease protein